MRVLKRDNTYEPISFDKVLRRIRNLCQNLKGVSADEISQKVCARIYDGVKTSELDELAAQLCASLLTTHPDYGFLASRIIISNHHKNTSPSFSETMGLLFNAKDVHGIQNALISQELWDIVKTHKSKLNSVIDYQRDFLFDYFGFKTLERSYLLKVDGKIVERPQHMWMRVALGIHGNDIKEALETYEHMSLRYFTHATPTLFNAGTPRAQLASCFLLGTHDSITGIFKTVTDSAQISKYAGGIGIHIHDIRACGSYIRGTNGNSTGIIPMLRVFNNTARYVNQCFKGDTIVYTKNGIKQMDQVSENDNLITHDGTFKNVLGISRNFIKKQILTIKITHAMENVDVTKEHQIYTLRNQALMLNYSTIRKRLETKTIALEYCDAKELKKGDFVGFPIPKYIQDHSETIDFFRFYGILIGDGHVCANRNEYGLTLGFNKSATFEFAKTFLEKRGIHTWFAKDTSKHTNMIRWSGNSEKLPIPREDVYIEKIKNIPAKYLHLPEDKTMAIIQGLLETDGSILGEIMFFNTSKNVVYSLRYMLLRMGILTSGNLKKCEDKLRSITYKNGKQHTIISKKDCYNLRIPKHPKLKTIMGDTIEYSSTIKYFEYDNILWSRIKSVTEKDYEGYVYDFNMCDNHNYMTDMGLVHNSGKRNGSIAMYLEPWHADIEAFLDIRKNHGSEEDRCRDLFTAMWIPDLFMKRIQENGDWSLMCPDESRGLSDAVGEEFETLYQKYEAEGTFRKKIKAQQLWMAILKSQIETGTPYLCYKDAANKKSNQKNLGTIKSSNLCSEILEYSNHSSYATCLTGETKILTENGLKRIDECNNETVLSYFSDDKNLIKKPTFVKSELINNGEKEVYSISFLNSRKITATKDHLFLIRTGRKQSIKSDTYEWRKLENIKKGDNIVLPANDVLPGYDINIKINVDDEYAVAGWMIGDGWQRAVKENNTITLNYGVCFGKYDDYAKDKVIPILNNIQQTQQSICKRSIKEYSDKKGTTCWQTKQYSFAKYFKDKYGFEEHLGPAKIIPNKIHNSSPNMKASFLSGLFSADGTVFIQSHFNISLSSASIELLYEVQEMLRCFGIHSKVQYSYIKSRDRSQGNVIIHGIQNIKRFLKYIGFTLSPTKQEKLEKGINTFNYERNRSINEYITVSNIEYAGKQQVYDLHVPETHNFIANGVISHNCNLASIALPTYVEYDEETGVPFYNFKKLHQIAQMITRNINKVIDRTFYPVPETESNNKQHRPIGIGVQGLANTFALMRMPFDSPEAAQLNKDIFETIYHGALTASMLLAKHREEMRIELDTPAIVLKRKRELLKYLQMIPEEINLTKYRGAYSSFDGSPASQGLLQFDLWGSTPGGVLWNWEELKGEITKYGIRNSLLLAPMPTASTSQIMGFNESIEPFTSNIYQRQTLAGEFVVINKHLIKDLLDAGLWNTEMKNRVFTAGGSIQAIEEIPENIRALYKTAWEMKQKVLIDQAADRGIYVCQSQSLNLFVEDPEFSKLSNMHFYGWKRGLKTGVYYLRTRPRAKITAFTIEPPKLSKSSVPSISQSAITLSSSNISLPLQIESLPTTPTEEQVLACRRDNPESCLMCGS